MKSRPRSGEARSGGAHTPSVDARLRMATTTHPASLAAVQFAVLQLAKDALADMAAVQDLRVAVDELLQAAAVTGVDADLTVDVTTARQRVEVDVELPEVRVDAALLETFVDRVEVTAVEGGVRVRLVHSRR